MTSRIEIAAVLAVVCGRAHADGVVTIHGREVAATPHRGEHACDDDPDCAITRTRAVSGLAFGALTATLGIGDRLAGGVRLDAVTGEYPFGRFEAGGIEARYLGPTERVHLVLVNAEVLFPCRDRDGELHAPISGQTKYACSESRLGVGGTIGELAWDPAAGRLAARWAGLHGVVDLLGASNSMTYLRHRLDASIGVDAESIWHGRGEMRTGSDHAARGVVSLAMMMRSDDAHWEARASAELRPVLVGTVASFTDVGVLGSGAVLYHLTADVSTGLEVRADRWSDPSTSIGALDSVAAKTSVFLGAIVEVRRESPR